MKIIITEQNLKRIIKKVLNEQSSDEITYVTKNDDVIYSNYPYFLSMDWISIPKGTTFKLHRSGSFVETFNGSVKFYCYSLGYPNNASKMTDNANLRFETKNNRFWSDSLTKVLDSKFCSKGQIDKKYKDYINKENLKRNKYENLKNVDKNCQANIMQPYKNAVTWWKNKMNEKAFFDKLKKLNNYSDNETKYWINSYTDFLNTKISGPYCLKKGLDDVIEDDPNTIAYASNYGGFCQVRYNIENQNVSKTDIEASFVHELQHCLYNLKPMTPDKNWKKVFPYKVWGGTVEKNENTKTFKNESNVITTYNLDKDIIKNWKKRFKLNKDNKPNYTCKITELSSRYVTIKKLLNKKTQDKITIEEFKKFLNPDSYPYDDENIFWFIICWIENDMPDIKTFLNNLDKEIVAKNNQNKTNQDLT